MNDGIPDRFDREAFAGVVGSPFRLSASSGQTVDLVLKEVSDLKERPGYHSFSIILHLPDPYIIEQGLYDIAHESLGDLQLLLVPVGKDSEGTEVEAVFTNLPGRSGGVSG